MPIFSTRKRIRTATYCQNSRTAGLLQEDRKINTVNTGIHLKRNWNYQVKLISFVPPKQNYA